jgi:predicted enzyme related to lactoylglutathione lyase
MRLNRNQVRFAANECFYERGIVIRMFSDMLLKIQSVVYFVEDPKQVATWYEALLQITPYKSDTNFTGFRVGEMELCFHKADAKSELHGAQIAYWLVTDLKMVAAAFKRLGATIYREPIMIEDGSHIMQMQDPFGNILGLFERA